MVRRELLITRSEAETVAVARDLAAGLEPGAAVLLVGELGSGKTAFVRGLAEGVGIPAEDVSSPTFTLIHEYRGRIPLLHVDLYRVAPHEVEDLGLEELGASGVLAIEWADKLPRPPGGSVTVRIEDLGEDRRRITVEY